MYMTLYMSNVEASNDVCLAYVKLSVELTFIAALPPLILNYVVTSSAFRLESTKNNLLFLPEFYHNVQNAYKNWLLMSKELNMNYDAYI